MSGTVSGYTDNNNNSIDYVFKKEKVNKADSKFYVNWMISFRCGGTYILYHFIYLQINSPQGYMLGKVFTEW